MPAIASCLLLDMAFWPLRDAMQYYLRLVGLTKLITMCRQAASSAQEQVDQLQASKQAAHQAHAQLCQALRGSAHLHALNNAQRLQAKQPLVTLCSHVVAVASAEPSELYFWCFHSALAFTLGALCHLSHRSTCSACNVPKLG